MNGPASFGPSLIKKRATLKGFDYGWNPVREEGAAQGIFP
jgi:hypothetical protein